MDWSKPFEASYRYMRVSRKTGRETARIGNVLDGGTIERNQDKTIKEGGSVRCIGSLDLGPDLLRVYLDALSEDGSAESVPLGTFLVRTDSRATDGTTAEVDVELLGRLAELDQCEFGQAFSIPPKTDLVAFAKGIVEDAGLSCVAEPSTYRNTDRLFYGIMTGEDKASADGSKLAVVNDMLTRAGFSSAWTDGMGTVHLTKYVEVADRPIAYSFVEGIDARFLRDVTDSTDTGGVANVVYTVFKGEEGTTIGTAKDEDPASRWSTVSLGREITSKAEYSEVADQAKADAKAAELLRSSHAVKRKVQLKHVYAPVKCGDAVRVEYKSGDVVGKMAVRTMRLEMVEGCLVETEVTSYVR